MATPIQKFAAADIPSSKEFLYSDALKFIKTVIQDIAKDYSPQNQIARQKQIHYNRPRYVPPDLRRGNGRKILNKEPDQWICEDNTVAHNLNGARGNTDCRGKAGTVREHRQMIVAPNGMIVNTPENMGTYDFVPPGGINTFIYGVVDVIPWIMWGNSENDRTSIGERLLSIGKGIINKSTDYFADEE